MIGGLPKARHPDPDSNHMQVGAQPLQHNPCKAILEVVPRLATAYEFGSSSSTLINPHPPPPTLTHPWQWAGLLHHAIVLNACVLHLATCSRRVRESEGVWVARVSNYTTDRTPATRKETNKEVKGKTKNEKEKGETK